MFSEGEHVGFKVTVTRPNQSEFNEFDAYHITSDEGGQAVTDCWLESEDDAIFEIKIEMTSEAMDIPIDTNWEVRVLVDGRSLETPWWQDHSVPLVITSTSSRFWRDSDQLRFPPADVGQTTKHTTMTHTGTIKIELQPGKVKQFPGDLQVVPYTFGRNQPASVRPASPNKIWEHYPFGRYDLPPHHPAAWQTFIFHYRRRAELCKLGILPRPYTPRRALNKQAGRTSKRPRGTICDDIKERENVVPPGTSLLQADSPAVDLDLVEEDPEWEEALTKRLGKLQSMINESEVAEIKFQADIKWANVQIEKSQEVIDIAQAEIVSLKQISRRAKKRTRAEI